MGRAWLRLTLLGAFVSSAAPALAADDQAADDEEPGSRARSGQRRRSEQAEDRDTPRAESPGVRPARAQPASTTVETGDSAVRLDNAGIAHEGVYNGVTIGGQNLPPRAPKLPLKTGPQRMTWPGFQVVGGVPTVFLQTTGVPDYAVTDGKGAVVVTLRRTSIKLRNNQRPLKVAEFGTDVTEVSARPRGKDVIVTIKHRGVGAHRERVEPSAGGFSLLVVELPGR